MASCSDKGRTYAKGQFEGSVLLSLQIECLTLRELPDESGKGGSDVIEGLASKHRRPEGRQLEVAELRTSASARKGSQDTVCISALFLHQQQ